MRMVKFYLLFLFVLMPFVALAGDDIPPALLGKIQKDLVLSSNSQGYEFYVAIPPNEVSNYGFDDALEIYVASAKPCDVTIEQGPSRILVGKKKIAQPFGVITLGSGIISFKTHEVRVADRPDDRVLRITATQPISVYMINSKSTTTDGLMAIPTSAWGKDYIHCAYYDNNESSSVDPGTGYYWFGAGFIVIASQDNTNISVDIRGKGTGFGTTAGGNKIGDRVTFNLNAGQCYMIKGDGKTDGAFDITGSRIKSDKPIGLISFHERADLPALLGSSRDHLCEMLPPVQAWGKKYFSVEYDRNDKGDLFRMVASEPNTKYKITWFDKKSNKLIAKREGVLKNSGDFAEVIEVMSAPGPNIASVRGTSIWEADKPVLVMQYAYSSGWDGFSNFDPYMIVVTPVEQFTKTTIFQTPSSKAFTDNKFNLIAIGDTLDPVRSDSILKSITLDGVPIWKKDPAFLGNRIPNSDLFWMKCKVETGPHYIKGDTKFGGYIYGFTSVDSYGWPAAMAFNKIGETDTLPPVVTITGTCGEYEVTFTEKRNGKDGDDPKQVDMGVSEEPSLISGSFNFDDPYFQGGYYPWPPNYDTKFILRVTDKTKDALARFQVIDREGNVTVKEIYYYGDDIQSDPKVIAFGDVKLNTSSVIDVKLENKGVSKVKIKNISLKKGTYYKILAGGTPPEIEIEAGKFHTVKLQYNPTREGMTATDLDKDSLLYDTECLHFATFINGRGVVPRIEVEDFHAGPTVVGKKNCKDAGLRIKNPGTMPLVITGFDFITAQGPFTVSNPTTPALPITIQPGKEVYLKLVCFEPKSTGDFNTKVVFHSNAVGPDSVSDWDGTGIQPGPEISGYNWLEKRVKTVNTAQVFITNAGTSSLKVVGVKLENNGQVSDDGSYKIVSTVPALTSTVELYPKTETDPNKVTKITVNVEFTPQSENNIRKIKIIPVFAASDGIKDGSVFNYLEGIGILPKIEVIGFEFTPAIEVNKTHPVTGKVKVRSLSTSADLKIEKIALKGDIADFAFTPAFPTNTTLPKINGTDTAEYTFDVTFKPTKVGKRLVTVEVTNDAKEGPEVEPRIITSADVIGNAYDQGVNVSNIDFGTITRCDEPTKSFTINNTGTTNKIVVKSMKIVPATPNVYQILNFTPNMEIAPNGSHTFDVKMLSSTVPAGVYNVRVEIETDIQTLFAEIKGETFVTNIEISQPKLPKRMAAGMITNDKYQRFPVRAKINNGKWADAGITEFSIKIKYNPSWMKFDGKIEPTSITNGWDFGQTKEVIVSPTSAYLEVVGKGNSPLAGSDNEMHELFNPVFILLLSDSSSFSPVIDEITFNNRNACVVPSAVNGEIKLESCVQDLRIIKINSKQFALGKINPNPISSNSFNLSFGVGLDNVDTRIEIINSIGEVVKVISNTTLPAGDYNLSVPIDELPSGVYNINMVSGPFKQTEKLVISK